jgi:hypothetical protein
VAAPEVGLLEFFGQQVDDYKNQKRADFNFQLAELRPSEIEPQWFPRSVVWD